VGGFWLVVEGTDSNLGGVEELGAFDGVDGANDHAMSGAGDEVADVFEAGEIGHGVAVGIDGA